MNEAGLLIAPLAIEAWALRSGRHSFHVIRCGMGSARARQAAHRIRSDPAAVVAVGGLCGALDANFQPGDLVVPDELRFGNHLSRRLDVHPLRRILAQRGMRVHGGTLVSADRIVTGSKRSKFIDSDTGSGAGAIDMESGWLAEAAGSRPFAVMRVVVDGPAHELFRASTLSRGWRALVQLRRASAALDEWASRALRNTRSNSSSIGAN